MPFIQQSNQFFLVWLYEKLFSYTRKLLERFFNAVFELKIALKVVEYNGFISRNKKKK